MARTQVVADPDGDRRDRARDGLPPEVRRLRMLTLLLITLVLIGAVPAALAIREATRDPVLIALEALDLPSTMAHNPVDGAFGNRWCLRQCRSRERTWDSALGVDVTAPAYERTLRDAGWRPWHPPGCPPKGIDGAGSCWQRDEYVLILYVRTPTCDGRPAVAPAPTAPAAPTAVPVAPPPPPPPGAAACPAAQATVKVFNRTSFRGGPG